MSTENVALLKEFISGILIEHAILNEYVVPMGFSLSMWKKHKKKYKISNVQFHKKHPDRAWKVVHGNKKGEVGKSLKGLNNISYNKANKAHSAIVMN